MHTAAVVPHAPSAAQQRDGNRTILKGVLTRLSGSTGFQLINVTNAPIILHGKRWNNLLVNKVGRVRQAQTNGCTLKSGKARVQVPSECMLDRC